MSSVVPSATANVSDTSSAKSAANPPAIATTPDASAANVVQNGAAQGSASATVNPSDTPSAQSATSATATTATPSPNKGAANPTQTQAATSSPPARNPIVASTKGTTPVAVTSATNSQDTSTPTSSSNTPSSSATPPVGGSASQPSASPTIPSSITSSGTTDGGSSPTASPTTGGSSTPGTDTQNPTNVVLTGASSPSSSPSAIAATSGSNSSLFKNKGAVIGIAAAGGLLIAIFLIYIIMRVRSSRRQRRLDEEMDASFQETMGQAAAGWRPGLDADAGLQRAPSAVSARSAASYAAYTEPPMAVSYQQQPNYGYAHQGAYAPAQEYWVAGPPAPAPRPSPSPVPQFVQPQRAQMYATQPQAQAAPGLVHRPSQSAVIQLHPETPVLQRDYLSNYTSPPPQENEYGQAGSPVSPTPMANPFDNDLAKPAMLPNPYGGVEEPEQRVLHVANE